LSDLDWEYPIAGGDSGIHHSSNDDVNLTALLTEFRHQLNNIDAALMATDALGTDLEPLLGDNNCSRPGWLETKTYSKGEEVEYESIRWRSKRTSQGVPTGTSPSKWSNLGLCVD